MTPPQLATALLTFNLDLSYKSRTSSVRGGIGTLLGTRHIQRYEAIVLIIQHSSLSSPSFFTTFTARFLAVFTVLGGFWGLQETHVYLHLAQEGVTQQSIGLSQAAATLAGPGFIS